MNIANRETLIEGACALEIAMSRKNRAGSTYESSDTSNRGIFTQRKFLGELFYSQRT